uniref:Uncharacterized protein n=1 Tax=Ascaris lumbricoides TaxID=6252 RepID=A0A0M3HM71_ASCLU
MPKDRVTNSHQGLLAHNALFVYCLLLLSAIRECD